MGHGNFFEFLLGGPVAGIDVGMIFTREFSVPLADLFRAGRALYA